MDEKEVRAKLMGCAAAAVEEMIAAMKRAPADNIVGGSEWPVHDAGKKFTRECFQALVGERMTQAEPERPAFSPTASRGNRPKSAGA